MLPLPRVGGALSGALIGVSRKLALLSNARELRARDEEEAEKTAAERWKSSHRALDKQRPKWLTQTRE